MEAGTRLRKQDRRSMDGPCGKGKACDDRQDEWYRTGSDDQVEETLRKRRNGCP